MSPRHKLIAIHPVHGYAITPQQDLKTIKRNARERNRIQAVNSCFENLRRRVPSAAVYKKMSKVNIVHHALEYIHQLMQMLQGDQISPPYSDTSSTCSSAFPSPSLPFPPQPSNAMSSYNSSLASHNSLEWAARSPFLPSPFLTPDMPHAYHQAALMNSPGYMHHPSQTPLEAANSPPFSAASEVDSSSRFGQYSPVTPPSPEEEEDVLDAIVEWQSC